MAQNYPSLVNASGSMGATTTEAYGAGGIVTNAGAGLYSITLDRPVDAAECACIITARGTAAVFSCVEQTSDSVKTVHMFNSSGTSTNAAFDWVIFQKPST